MIRTGNSAGGPSRSLPLWLAVAGIVAAVLLAYGNSLRAPFLFDDAGAVENNASIRRLWSLDVLRPPADGSTTTGRPIVNLTFALNYAMSGGDSWSYHVGNVALHAAAALALMGIVRRTFASTALRERFGAAAPALGFATALLWALHPLQTETVVCIAQRTELLCGLFYLLTIYGVVRATETGAAATRWLAFSVTACLLGMGTKEVMVTAPLVVLLYDRTFLAGSFTAAWRARRGYYGALAGTWLLLAWLVFASGGARGAAAGFGLGVTSWSYLVKQSEALVLYLRLALWPHPLVLDYGTSVAVSAADVGWQGSAVLLLLVGTVWALWRKPMLGFVGAWFFVILAPSSSVVPLVTQTMAEHRMYLPLAAVLTFLVAVSYRRLGPRAAWLGAAVAAVLAVATHARNEDFRDALAIWGANVRDFPSSARGHHNLAWTLQQRGRGVEASLHYARAVALDPGYVTAHYNWGVALLEQGRVADAITELEHAVRLAPQHADAQMNLGTALVRARRTVEGLPHIERALALRPAADAHFNLGIALAELGRREEASQHFRDALRLDPALAEAHYQLARIAEQSDRLAEAELAYGETLRLAPNHAAAHRKLGLLLARTDRLAAAAEQFRAVIRLQPDDADAHANLGNILLLQEHPREALASYEEALRLRPADSRLRENIRLVREALR